MKGIRPNLDDVNIIISFIPMCFVSWFVWQMVKDPFFARLVFTFGFWFVIPLIVWAIIVFLQSFWNKGRMWKLFFIWGCAIIVLIGAYYISPTRFGTRCTPDIMADHYEENKSGIQELIDYTNHSLDKGAQMDLEFEHGDISIFNVMKKNDSIWSYERDVDSEDKINTLMQKVGLDQEELDNIQRKLKKNGCISIETETTHSDYIDIGYRRLDFGMYYYRIYNRPLNAEEKDLYNKSPKYIPYTDKIVFIYCNDGGVIGPRSFDGEMKENFMKKHPVK